MTKTVFVIVCFLFGTVATVSAGDISGQTVGLSDPTQSTSSQQIPGIPGAKITVIAENGTQRGDVVGETFSDQRGNFRIELPADTVVTIEFEKLGRTTRRIEGVSGDLSMGNLDVVMPKVVQVIAPECQEECVPQNTYRKRCRLFGWRRR